MRIAIIHGMEIIVGYIILIQTECHGGFKIHQSCRNTLSIFIRIIPVFSRFQEFLLDIIRHLFCRHNMEDVSDRKGWLMIEGSIAAVHVSAHIAGNGFTGPGSIRWTGISYTHQITIWPGWKFIGNQTFIYFMIILHALQPAVGRIFLQLIRSLISIVIIPSEISSRFQICTIARIAGKWQRQFLTTAARQGDIIMNHMRFLSETVIGGIYHLVIASFIGETFIMLKGLGISHPRHQRDEAQDEQDVFRK